MADTYTLIEKITVGAAGASSVEFTSIPQTYTDLQIVLSSRGTNSSATEWVSLKFNGSSTSYSSRWLEGNGSGAPGSFTGPTNRGYAGVHSAATATASTFGNFSIYIPNYASSNNKSYSSDTVSENNATAATAELGAGLWSNSAAITSITLTPDNANFAQYSTFYLYGIAKEGVNPAPSSAPYATGGDSIVFDGTYWYHAFTSTGTFTPKKGLSCEILVVAGGGAGGNGYAGGGGAGGLLAHSNQSLGVTGYTVTIGAGAAGTATLGAGADGSNSQFGSLTASVGGGGGGGNLNGNGRTGGSGGGGARDTGTGGAATSGQGYAGTNASSGNYAGGGGGAGATSASGVGGAGSSTYSSYGSATSTGQNVSGTYFFAGGGAGYPASGAETAGGSGGGGRTGPGGVLNATANTGGGGGAWNGAAATSGNGGSGIVIVRYAA